MDIIGNVRSYSKGTSPILFKRDNFSAIVNAHANTDNFPLFLSQSRMKLQLVLLATLFALVYASPLPQAVEEVKPVESVSDAAAVATPEEPAPEVKSAAPTTVEPEAEQPTESPATTEAAASADAILEEKTASDDAAKKETDETPAVPVVQAGVVDDSPANAEEASAAVVASVDEVKESTAQVSADDVKKDTVQIADAVEPVAVASDEAARAVRTATDEEAEKKDEVAVTTEVPAEVQPVVKAADETAPAASSDDKPADAAAEAKTELPTTTVAAATLSAVTTQPAKADSSEESKESQESDEKP